MPGAEADVCGSACRLRLVLLQQQLGLRDVAPTTLGTTTFGGPLEIVTTTNDPCAPVAPPVGTVEHDGVFATVVEGCLTGETRKPAARSACVAAEAFRPTTFGT